MRNLYAAFSGVLIFCSCSVPAMYKVGISPLNDITLMPFYSDSGDLGYINAETLKIIIPGQYTYAGPFTGDFAIVSKDEKLSNTNTPNLFIINKNNEVVIKKINGAVLFASEDENHIFALTVNYSGIFWNKTPRLTIIHPLLPIPYIDYDYQPKTTHYKLYNLNTGKCVIRDTRDGFDKWERYSVKNDYRPKIMFFSHYLAYDEDLYEINSNGTLTKSKTSLDDAVSQIIKERNLSHIEINYSDYRFYDFSSYLRYSDNLDRDLLSKIVPDNMVIRGASPINQDEVHPLKSNNVLYTVKLRTNEQNWKDYVGLYDESAHTWIIPPLLDGSEFSSTGYDDWVILKRWTGSGYINDYYNIKKGKIYKGLYTQQEFKKEMTYYGYARKGGHIEDF
jgi:hypothetical protein